MAVLLFFIFISFYCIFVQFVLRCVLSLLIVCVRDETNVSLESFGAGLVQYSVNFAVQQTRCE